MRQINLTGLPLVPSDVNQVEKLTGHLNARMEELIEDGLTVSHRIQNGVGLVSISFPNMEGARAQQRLSDYGVAATEESNQVIFRVTGLVSHEDLDYVQGAVMEILYG